MDDGESICLAGETLARRWLMQAGATSAQSRRHIGSRRGSRRVTRSALPSWRRWLVQALSFLRAPGYASVPKFAFTALNDVHCRCRSGASHLDLELSWFLSQLDLDSRKSRTVVLPPPPP